jgi:hypothetical protein
MRKLYTTLVICLTVLPQLFGFSIPSDSLIRIKPDSIIKAQRDSVLAPPIGFELRGSRNKDNGVNTNNILSISTPTLVSPINGTVYGTSVSLYWNKNNAANAADYFVKIIDLTNTTILYNYTPVGDLSSFEARNLVAGRTYSWVVRAVSRTNSSDVLETPFSNFVFSNVSPPTLSLTSISGTTFCGANRSITIGFSRSGSLNYGSITYNGYYNYGNIFVELSNKNGDFINPILLTGTSQSGTTGSFSINLPENLPFGQNYKIRLISYAPIVTSSMSAAITIGTISNPLMFNKFNVTVNGSYLDLCSGGSALVKMDITDSSDVVFQWRKDNINITTGGNYSNYVIRSGGNYKLSVTQGTCPTVTSSNGVQIYTYTGGNSVSLWREGSSIQCAGGSVKLIMPYWADNQTYKWYKNDVLITGATQREYVATQTGSYSVKASSDNNCIMSATGDALTFGSAISISSNFGANNICSTGGVTSASVNPSYSPTLATNYQWKRNGVNISGATSSNLTITQAGVYNAEVVQGGCTAVSQGFEVTASTTLDSIKILPNYSSYCNSSSVYLSPSVYLANATYRWRNTGITVNTNSNHNAIEDGNYTLTVTQGTCSTTSQVLALALNTNREITLYLDGSSSYKKDTIYICSDSPRPIYVNNYPSGTYQWFKDNVAISGATSTFYSTSQRGSYTFQVTSGSCVIMSKPIFVENTLPKFSLNITPANNSLCSNNIYTLDYYNKGIYAYNCSRWKKDGVVINNCANQISVFESGIYTAIMQQGSCVVESEALKISVGEAISAVISGNSTIASGGSAKVYLNFTGASPWTFTLSDGSTITTSKNPYILSVSPSSSTTYSLTSLIGSCGTGTVSGSATVTIGTCTTPTLITVQPSSKTKCTGSNVSFSVVATGGGTLTYQWKKDGQNILGANTATLTLNDLKITDLGNYSVEVVGTCGSVLSDVAILKITNEVPFYISSNTVNVTLGSNISLQTYTFTGIIPTGFSWQGPNGFTSSQQNLSLSNVSIANSGNYTVSASNSQGCKGQAIASVTVISPSITINNLSNTIFCTGQTGTISFTPPAGNNSTYGVQISYSDGTFVSNSTTLGTSNTSPITFTMPVNYSSSTTNSYKLRVIDINNSNQVSSPSAIVYFNTFTANAQSITDNNYASLCQGSSVKIYSKLNVPDNGDVTYEWQKDNVVIAGATSAIYTTNQTGSYKVKATKTGCGVSLSNTMSIASTTSSGGFSNYFPLYQCAGTSLVLKAAYNSESASYSWQKNGVTLPTTTNSLTVSQSGDYSLTIADPNCFSSYQSSTSFIFSGVIPSDISVSGDTVLTCLGYGVFMSFNSSSNNSYTYQWRRNGEPLSDSNNNYYYVSTPGTYAVKITQGNCSTTSKSVVVKSGGVPSNIIKARGGTNICTGLSPTYLYVDGIICGSYQWQKDQVDIISANGSSYYPTQSGSYRLKINSNGIITYTNAISITVGNTASYEISTSSDTISCIPYAYYNLFYTNSLSGATFQWMKNNTPIVGANSTGYSIESVGVYKLKVTIGTCVGYSQDVNFTVKNALTKPILVSQQGKIVCGQTYTVISPQSQTLPYSVGFQWKKDGVEIPNTYYRSYINATESGTYTVKYTQGPCTAESDPIAINVGDKQQSIKTADWNNIATWSCGTIPTVTEGILINRGHIVNIPDNYTGFLKNMELNGNITQGTNAKLKFSTN